MVHFCVEDVYVESAANQLSRYSTRSFVRIVLYGSDSIESPPTAMDDGMASPCV